MRVKIFVLFAILFFQYNLGFAQPIRIGLLNFPPFGIEGENEFDPPSGIMVDRLSKTFSNIGLESLIRIYPAKRAFAIFENGTIDFILASESKVSQYKEIAIFSENPIMKIQLRAYVFAKNIPLPQKKEDLNGLRVTTMRGYSYLGYLKYINDPINKIENNCVNSHESGFLLLISGRTDILLDYAFPAKSAMQNYRQYEFNHSILFEQKIFFALSKKYPNKQVVLDRIIQSYEASKF